MKFHSSAQSVPGCRVRLFQHYITIHPILLLRSLSPVLISPTAVPLSVYFQSHRMQSHTADSDTDAPAEHILLLH